MPATLEVVAMPDQDQIIADLERRLREQELWAVEHDGRINEKWANQERWNSETDATLVGLREHLDTKFGQVFSKLARIELRIAGYAGLATLAGASAVKYLFP